MRVIGLMPEPTANAEYRLGFPVRALAEAGHDAEVIGWDYYRGAEAPPIETLTKADAVHLWRIHEPPIRRLASTLRDAGVGVVWDNDDDMLRNPNINDIPKQMSPAREKTNAELIAMMRLADVVTATCEELARRFRKLSGVEVQVIENFLEARFVQTAPPVVQHGLVIGWVAGGEHRIDLKQLRLRGTLDRILQTHPHVRVVSVGLDLGLRSDRYEARPSVPLPALPSAIAQFDIAIAPIADISFNRTRSNVKLKEYAGSGVPWLASPTGPYRELGEEQGGRLVPDALWQQRLEELIADHDLRDELARRAAAWGQTQTIARNVHHWETVFAQAAERARARTGRPAPASGGGNGAAPRSGLLSRLRRSRG